MNTDEDPDSNGGPTVIDEQELDGVSGAGRTYTGGRFQLEVSGHNVAHATVTTTPPPSGTMT